MICPQFAPSFCILPRDPLSLFHPLIPGRNFTLGLSLSPWHYCVIPLSLSNTPPKKNKKNAGPTKWILWANHQTFSQTPKHGGSLLPLRRSSVDLGRELKKSIWQKRCFQVREERLERQQGQSKSKLGSAEQTRAAGTQRRRDGCLWSW